MADDREDAKDGAGSRGVCAGARRGRGGRRAGAGGAAGERRREAAAGGDAARAREEMASVKERHGRLHEELVKHPSLATIIDELALWGF